jgi:predicted MPP superfamily phosphohydrolase
MPAMSRRAALRTLAAMTAGASAGVTAHGYFFERHALQVVRTDLPVAGLPPGLDGLRVGFVTDLHLSESVPADDIQRALALAAAERPDVVVFGGDYVSYQDMRYVEPVAELLATANAPLGVIAILGNHDDDRAVPAALARRGITVLRDGWMRLSRSGASLSLAGVRFWTKKRDDIAAAISGAPAPVVLLAHDPRRVVEASVLGIPAVLSGHTHGGQVVLPGLGAVAARKFPIAAGRLTVNGTELFVSRGVGTVILPIRINCPPEIAIVTLRGRA